MPRFRFTGQDGSPFRRNKPRASAARVAGLIGFFSVLAGCVPVNGDSAGGPGRAPGIQAAAAGHPAPGPATAEAAAPRPAVSAMVGGTPVAGGMHYENALERDIFSAVNIKRLERRLPPLEWDDRLAGVARRHTLYLAAARRLCHIGSGGSRLTDRISGIAWIEAGENLARNKGFADPVRKAVQDWVDSPGHAENLYSVRYRRTGVGVVRTADGFYYFTQVFTLPPPS